MIPIWLKIAYTLFVCMLVPIYWRQYGPVNFLCFFGHRAAGTGPGVVARESLPRSHDQCLLVRSRGNVSIA